MFNVLKNTKGIVIGIVSALILSASALATPSTQIWIPSTDIQATGTFHLGLDNYSSVGTGTAAAAGVTNYFDGGLTYGALPGLEVGFDYISTLQYPVVFNVKYGISEPALPVSVAVGAYNIGLTATSATVLNGNDQNIIYGLVAKNFDGIGRFSAGYYSGNSKNAAFDTTVLVNGKAQESSGLLLSFDKQINDKVWAAVDYQGGYNFFGAVSFGVSYAFAPNTSVIFGYDMYTITPPTGTPGNYNTFTTQLDINF